MARNHEIITEPACVRIFEMKKKNACRLIHVVIQLFMPHEIAQKLMAVVHFLTDTDPQAQLNVKVPKKKYIAEDHNEVHAMEEGFYVAVLKYLTRLKKDVVYEKARAMNLLADPPHLQV